MNKNEFNKIFQMQKQTIQTPRIQFSLQQFDSNGNNGGNLTFCFFQFGLRVLEITKSLMLVQKCLGMSQN